MIKAKDITALITAVIVFGIISYFISSQVFKVERVKTTVEVVEPISADFPLPDNKYFNDNSIDPTVIITINEGETDPF